MLIPFDPEPTAGWAVQVGHESGIRTAYLCDSEEQAYALANKHRIQWREPARAVLVAITITERTP